jgi:hypothetical protein
VSGPATATARSLSAAQQLRAALDAFGYRDVVELAADRSREQQRAMNPSSASRPGPTGLCHRAPARCQGKDRDPPRGREGRHVRCELARRIAQAMRLAAPEAERQERPAATSARAVRRGRPARPARRHGRSGPRLGAPARPRPGRGAAASARRPGPRRTVALGASRRSEGSSRWSRCACEISTASRRGAGCWRPPPQMHDSPAQHGVREQADPESSSSTVEWPSQASRSAATSAR